MSCLISLLAVFSSLVVVTLGQSDYCGFTRRHTMCLHQGQIGGNCGGQPLERGVSEDDKRTILRVHNQLRAKVARGDEQAGAPGPQPSASNMIEMTWDEELARVAQTHADQCVFDHDCSDCRRVARFKVGQNLYTQSQSHRKNLELDWGNAIKEWYNEVSDVPRSTAKSYRFNFATGHYTQIVWAKTSKVGCGVSMYKDGPWFTALFTCNYGPAGNFRQAEMYKAGPACSECPQGSQCSQKYKGLCSAADSEDLGDAEPQPQKPQKPKPKKQPKKQPKKPPKKPPSFNEFNFGDFDFGDFNFQQFSRQFRFQF